jgi:hypothetical protein
LNVDLRNLWQFPVGDEIVLARGDAKGLFLLNSSASVLWRELAVGADPAEMAAIFASRYGIPAELARRDVESALANWSESLLSPERRELARKADYSTVLREAESDTRMVRTDCVLNGRGFRVMLESGDIVEEIVPRLVQVAAPQLAAGMDFQTFVVANGEDRALVFRDGVCVAEEEKISAARAILLQEMTGQCEPGRDTRAILHAGACGPTDECVILAGATHAGKSTLCAALMGRGLYCYSDDSAVLDRQFRVCGMPFPTMVREESWPVIASCVDAFYKRAPVHQRWGMTVRFLPSNLPRNSSPVARAKALVFVEYRPGSEATVVEPLTPFEAMVGLQQGGFWVEHSRESIADFLAWIQGLECRKLRYSQIDEACDAVTGLLARANAGSRN